MCGKSPMLV